jgi:hypothetical protein
MLYAIAGGGVSASTALKGGKDSFAVQRIVYTRSGCNVCVNVREWLPERPTSSYATSSIEKGGAVGRG